MKQQINKTFIPIFNKARESYLNAKALNQVHLDIDAESKQEVLSENIFVYGQVGVFDEEKGTRITNHKRDYNMTDEDFTRYSKLTHVKRLEKGLILPYDKFEWSLKEPWNLTSDCETREILRKAEDKFIEASLNILPKEMREQLKGINTTLSYKRREEFININLSLEV